MGLLQKGVTDKDTVKQLRKMRVDALKSKGKTEKATKYEDKLKAKAAGKVAKADAKDKKKIRRGQKSIDRKTYGSGKKGKAAKAAAIAGKAADAKMEAVGMGDPADATMDGASMANPNTKKKRVKSKTERLSELKSPRRKGNKGKKRPNDPTIKTTIAERKDLLKKLGTSSQQAMRKMGGSMMKKEGASMMKKEGASMSGEKYDAKQAYNKNLSASSRLHYLENNRADKKAKGGSHRSTIMKHMKNI